MPCQELSKVEPGHLRIELLFWNLHDKSVFPKPVVIHRDIPATDAIARAAVEAWVAGPTRSERKLGALRMANTDTEIAGVSVHGDAAWIDLNAAFHETGLGTCCEGQVMTSLVGVLTQFEPIERVRLMWNGKFISAWGGHGGMLERDGEPRPPPSWYRVIRPCP